MKKNLLIVGSGGREHALAWRLSQSPLIGNTYLAPGNGGTRKWNIPIQTTDIDALIDFSKAHNCVAIVGPEAPLEGGIVDRFEENGLKAFGPNREQARLETSKVFAKEFMLQNSIPTAQFKTFNDADKAIDYSNSKEGHVVIKADGLASGKGVFVCSNKTEARNAIIKIMEEKIFGNSGNSIVIEEKLSGNEVSIMTICDGREAILLGVAVDHKKLLDGDLGPNTGGMGAYSPVDSFTLEMQENVMKTIIGPTVRETGFVGFLYAGLMVTEDGIMVLEFNARLGDPETQAIFPLLESDIMEPILSICDQGRLKVAAALKHSSLYTSCVVMCSEGYPFNVISGAEISGLQLAESGKDVLVFHSATRFQDGLLYTSGGRVVCVTGMGITHQDATARAYAAVSKIHWKGENHRSDIGLLKRLEVV